LKAFLIKNKFLTDLHNPNQDDDPKNPGREHFKHLVPDVEDLIDDLEDFIENRTQ